MLPPKPSISNGICDPPRLVQVPPGREAHFPTQTLLSATTLAPGISLGVTHCCLPQALVASCCIAHSLAVSGSDWNLIGSLKNPDCLIIIRQRNYQAIKGCSQLLYELSFVISRDKRPLDRDKSQPAFLSRLPDKKTRGRCWLQSMSPQTEAFAAPRPAQRPAPCGDPQQGPAASGHGQPEPLPARLLTQGLPEGKSPRSQLRVKMCFS